MWVQENVRFFKSTKAAYVLLIIIEKLLGSTILNLFIWIHSAFAPRTKFFRNLQIVHLMKNFLYVNHQSAIVWHATDNQYFLLESQEAGYGSLQQLYVPQSTFLLLVGGFDDKFMVALSGCTFLLPMTEGIFHWHSQMGDFSFSGDLIKFPWGLLFLKGSFVFTPDFFLLSFSTLSRRQNYNHYIFR